MTTDLEARTGWPAELRFLLARYPRETWGAHAKLGDMARFWLARHDMFRELGATLDAAAARFRDGALTAREFQARFTPRLKFFLSQLEVHHQVEDQHYFPIFRVAEARLARGFDVLEADHAAIHRAIADSVTAANAVLGLLDGDADALRRANETYAAASGRLLVALRAHLRDEEDLIIPLILDRGEDKLGVG